MTRAKIRLLLLICILNFFLWSCEEIKSSNFSHIPNASFVAKDGDNLFYTFFDGYEYALIKSDLNGGNQVELVRSGQWQNNISVSDGWVYYSSSGYINRIRIDGSDSQMIVYAPLSIINVVGEWIYFQKDTPWANGDQVFSDYSIWRIKIDGTQEQEIIDDGGRSLTVVDDYIYYLSYDSNPITHGDYTLCKIKADGTGDKQILSEERIYTMVISNGMIYCGRPRHNPNPENAFMIDLNGNNKKELEFSATSMFVYNNHVYYNFYFSDSAYVATLHKYNLETGETKEIINLNQDIVGDNSFPQILFLSIVNDNIYFITPITQLSETGDYHIAQRGIYRSDLFGNNLTLLSQGQ